MALDDPISSTWSLWRHGFRPAWRRRGAEERFVSEALSLATRADFAPMARALAHLPGLAFVGDATHVDATTEYRVGTRVHGEGSIDVRLVVEGPTGQREIWLEVKVHAWISGHQLVTYATARHHLPRAQRPRMVFLGGSGNPRAKRGYLPWLSWQDVHDAIDTTDASVWRDLRRYLEEEGLVTAMQHDA